MPEVPIEGIPAWPTCPRCHNTVQAPVCRHCGATAWIEWQNFNRAVRETDTDDPVPTCSHCDEPDCPGEAVPGD